MNVKESGESKVTSRLSRRSSAGSGPRMWPERRHSAPLSRTSAPGWTPCALPYHLIFQHHWRSSSVCGNLMKFDDACFNVFIDLNKSYQISSNIEIQMSRPYPGNNLLKSAASKKFYCRCIRKHRNSESVNVAQGILAERC